jgi:hypothetical protein
MKTNLDTISNFMIIAAQAAEYLEVDEQHLLNCGWGWGLDVWNEQPGRGKLYYPVQIHEFKRFGLEKRPLITAKELIAAVDPCNNL